MESEPPELDENETDTDNYDVVYNVRSGDETKKIDSPASISSSGPTDSNVLTPPPLPQTLRGSHNSLISAEVNHAPRPPPRGRRVHSDALSPSSSTASIDRPRSMLANEQESPVDDADATEPRNTPVEQNGLTQVHFSGDSQASQDSSEC